jgi:acid phosphatase
MSRPVTKVSSKSDRRAGRVQKVLTIVEENHSLDQMKRQMPYLDGLAERFAYADHYTAITHPSLPNYIAIAGGHTAGILNDAAPAAHVIRGQSIFGQALAAGKTAKVYEESMPTNCAVTGNVDRGYAVKHNPWAYYADEREACRKFDVSSSSFLSDARSNDLPNAGMLVPNRCNDAHDKALGCNLATADQYLASILPTILGSSDFTSGNLAVVVTADEDNDSSSTSGGPVLTVVLHASLDGSHLVVSTPLTHFSLSRLYSQVIGAPALRRAATAPDMAGAFRLPVA